MTHLDRIINQDASLAAAVLSLPWVTDGIATHESAALSKIASIATRDTALARTIVGFSWMLDDISGDESNALQNLSAAAAGSVAMSRSLVSFPWVADDITEQEWNAIGRFADLAQMDPSIAETVVGFPWVADDINEHERWSLRYLSDLTNRSLDLGARAAQLPWVIDEITEDERWTLWLLNDLAASDATLAGELMAMPFLTASFETRDRHALNSLRLLNESPSNLEFVTDQPWFKNGLDDVDASFVAVLYDLSIRSPDEFTTMVVTRHVKTSVFTLPLAGETEIIAFRLTSFSLTSTVLSQVESAVRAMEQLMGVPFPRNEIILLFLDPTDFQKIGVVTLALHVGTHMIVSRPEVIQGDFKHTLAHEIAHYYWGSQNAPLWFREGGADFLASYALDQSQQVSLSERRHQLDIGGARTCAIAGIDYIQRLIDDLAAQGYSKHQSSYSFLCNYALGEFLLLNLYQAMGFDGSSNAWNELYLLAKAEGRPVTEQEIHQAFFGQASASQLAEVSQLYDRWHRGDFSP